MLSPSQSTVVFFVTQFHTFCWFNLQGTRWTPHFLNALSVLVQSYGTIRAHFEHTVETRVGTAEVLGRATNILGTLRDYSKLAWTMFHLDVLQVLRDLSLAFQKDSTTLNDALDALSTANLSLIALTTRPGEKLAAYLDEVQGESIIRIINMVDLFQKE